MKKILALMVGVLTPWAGAVAAEFDGSTPLICAIVDVQECDARVGCEIREAEDIDMAQFLRVDAVAKTLTSTRPEQERRESAIRHVGHEEGNLVLQGAEAGRGWSMVIAEDTGTMSGALVSKEAVFVVFGACTTD